MLNEYSRDLLYIRSHNKASRGFFSKPFKEDHHDQERGDNNKFFLKDTSRRSNIVVLLLVHHRENMIDPVSSDYKVFKIEIPFKLCSSLSTKHTFVRWEMELIHRLFSEICGEVNDATIEHISKKNYLLTLFSYGIDFDVFVAKSSRYFEIKYWKEIGGWPLSPMKFYSGPRESMSEYYIPPQHKTIHEIHPKSFNIHHWSSS